MIRKKEVGVERSCGRRRRRRRQSFGFLFSRRALESFAPHFYLKKRSLLSIPARGHARRRVTPPGCRDQRTERTARSTARIKRAGFVDLKKSVVVFFFWQAKERRRTKRSRSPLFLDADQKSLSTYQRERGVRGNEGRERGGAGHQLGDGGGLLEMKRGAARGGAGGVQSWGRG